MAATILLVEDDYASRTGLVKVLKNAGYEVFDAATFEEGRRLLNERNPDLLVVDLRLGGFNGLQLIVTHPMPAIVITGFADPVLETEAKHLGAEFLIKPFSPKALLRLIDEKLGRTDSETTFDRPRRWTRKPVPGELVARVDSSHARILDVSYGGMRFALDDNAVMSLPSSFEVNLPSKDVAVHVDLVWQSRTGDGSWLCGAALSQTDTATATAWHGLVDALA
jgi:DNA-binding response OmpR family regulator